MHPIFEGIDLSILHWGPGHWPGSARPGEVGNAVFAGHRVTHTRPFLDIDRLVAGDRIIFRVDVALSIYRVTTTTVVPTTATASAPLAAVTMPTMTSTTATTSNPSSSTAPTTRPPTTGATRPVATPSKEAAVAIVIFTFSPPSLTVAPGTKVTWTNQDDAPHSIQDSSPVRTPVSQDMAKGGTFSITYRAPGNYEYICGIHNYMTGSVTVR